MEKVGPWTRKSSREVYANTHGIKLQEDIVIAHNGKVSEYAIFTTKEGVSILPVDAENNVYLIKSFLYPVAREDIHTAGGGIEQGESPAQAAARELLEELDMNAEEMIDVGIVEPTPSLSRSKAYMFIAKNCTKANKEIDDIEVIEPLKITLQEAVQKVMDSEITHAQSCVLILKANELLNKQLL